MSDKPVQRAPNWPENAARNPAVDTVLEYLAAMENRQIEAARKLLSPEFTMTFPGPVQLASLEELMQWASTRYRRIAKRIDGIDTGSESNEGVVVYCFGTLYGEWNSGESFDDVRFIDRFVFADGLLQDQNVWNDLGEVRPTDAAVRPNG